MQRIGEIFASDYELVKPSMCHTLDSITRALESTLNGINQVEQTENARFLKVIMRTQALKDQGIKLFFDNAHFIIDQPENSDQEITNIHNKIKKFFNSLGINAKMMFASTKHLGLNMATIRIPSPNQQALKTVFSAALKQEIEEHRHLQDWLDENLPEPGLRQKNLDKLSEHTVNMLIDVCNEFDVYVELAHKLMYFNWKEGELKTTQNRKESSNLLIPRVEFLLKWVFMDPKRAFSTPEELGKVMVDFLGKTQDNVAFIADSAITLRRDYSKTIVDRARVEGKPTVQKRKFFTSPRARSDSMRDLPGLLQQREARRFGGRQQALLKIKETL